MAETRTVLNRLAISFVMLAIGLFPFALKTLAGEPTPEDYVQFMKPLVGSWKTTTESDGKSISGTMSYELAPNAHCFLGRYENNVLPDAQSIEGYDPASEKHTFVAFCRDGTYAIATVDWGTYLQPGKTFRKGVTGKQSVKLFSRDGKTVTATATVTCATLEQGKVVLEYSDGLQDGKSLPDLKMTMEAMPVQRP